MTVVEAMITRGIVRTPRERGLKMPNLAGCVSEGMGSRTEGNCLWVMRSR